MNARAAAGRGGRSGPPAGHAGSGAVVDLDRRRIECALPRRSRYRYVQPRIEPGPEGAGWRIVSPNCSRNIDRDGGEIDIAWLEPEPDGRGRWRLHRRDHRCALWTLHSEGLTLPEALTLLCEDSSREFWT